MTRHRALLLVLVTLTMLSSLWTHDIFGYPLPAAVVAALLYAIALIKVRFIILHMMEVRGAPRALRIVLEGWTVGLWIALSGIYLVVG